MAMTPNSQSGSLQRHAMPPQAYTRETLVKAINWVSGQPEAVRERAASADVLVSLYLQAARKAEANQEAPVSGESFREDLKNLANDLKKFEVPFAPPTGTTRSPSPSLTPFAVPQASVQATVPANPAYMDSPLYAPQTQPAGPMPVDAQPQKIAVGEPIVMPNKTTTWQIDTRSLAVAKELQHRLNLGSEVEAIRLLITLGSERARDLFP